MQNIWLVVDLLHQNSHWWFAIALSMDGVNFETRMLDNILYVVDNSDFPLQLLQPVLPYSKYN
jgi:hypothetical protein